MPSNFAFLKPDFPQLFDHAANAEGLVYSAPRASCFYARFTLEQTVIWLYDNDPYLKLPYDNTLNALLHEKTFQDNLSPHISPKLRTIQKMGNVAVHRAVAIASKDSLYLIEELFHFLYWVCRYYSPNGRDLGKIDFDPQLIPQPIDTAKAELTKQQLQQREKELSQIVREMKRIDAERQQQTQNELDRRTAEMVALKQNNSRSTDSHDYNEKQTRDRLIDVLLKEMGWDLTHADAIEYPVEGMPKSVNPSGKGRIDYVLWDDNGLPLAVVEAKRTRKSPQEGQQQAKLYADCLEKKFGQRPIIFYSNGYKTYIWDDRNYPPREIQGFLKKDELQYLIWQRDNAKTLNAVNINPEIAGGDRTYQTEAIRRISETYTQRSRKALLVMATGTGKTRTAIALADILMRANWVKRVLFLADRKTLVTQAQRAFNKYLPDLNTVNLLQEKDIAGANAVFSTYPTIANEIDKVEKAGRKIGPGYFDLVIIDEAHRSVYKKYRYLFEYFDSLLLGLTATPRDEVNRDTYQLFNLEPGTPTFAYELGDAIADGHLVPPKGINVSFKFLRSGIKYNELSPEEREEYEEAFANPETGEIPGEIEPTAINDWLFNGNTIDQALEVLMELGLCVDGGDRLAKTIIFARNHRHALKIEEHFNRNYPHYKGTFARIIDSHDPYAQTVFDEFSEAEKDPAIAISVDMLDTGVDVPEIANLVFFKPVYSRVKFNQMIGRGTRLRPNLFGSKIHKTEFYIFDLCDNFAYFQQQVREAERKPADSLTAKIFKTRLKLYQQLNDAPELGTLREEIGDRLHAYIASMEPQNFIVRRHLKEVEAFSQRNRWAKLDLKDLRILADDLAHLPHGLPRENPLIKRFDLLCFHIQLAIAQNCPDFTFLQDKVRDLLDNLEQKQAIPMVAQQFPLIEAARSSQWWQNVNLIEIESLRKKLRNLMQFVDRQVEAIVYTDFQDELGDLDETEVPIQQTGFSSEQYCKKVTAYIRANQDHIAIAKLRRNLPLTETDLHSLETMLFAEEGLENREKFARVLPEAAHNLPRFIRSLVGLDREAAKKAFARYLDSQHFNANQIRFVEQIIDWLTQQGTIEPAKLYKPPFTDFHDKGLDGVFSDRDADNIIEIARSFNQTVASA